MLRVGVPSKPAGCVLAMEVSQLSKNNGFVVGVVSSQGHESGHIQVWDVLSEVEAIHVCTIDDEADLDAIAALSPKTVSKTKDLSFLLSTPGLDAVAAPAPSPIESSVHLLEVVEAAKESSCTGRAVRISGRSTS